MKARTPERGTQFRFRWLCSLKAFVPSFLSCTWSFRSPAWAFTCQWGEPVQNSERHRALEIEGPVDQVKFSFSKSRSRYETSRHFDVTCYACIKKKTVFFFQNAARRKRYLQYVRVCSTTAPHCGCSAFTKRSPDTLTNRVKKECSNHRAHHIPRTGNIMSANKNSIQGKKETFHQVIRRLKAFNQARVNGGSNC